METTKVKECKTCHNEALDDSKYCTSCWSAASQNGATSSLITDDRAKR